MKPVKIEEVPTKIYGAYTNQVDDFAASEYSCAELENVDNATSAYSSVWHYVRRKNLNIEVARRKNRIFLIKKD